MIRQQSRCKESERGITLVEIMIVMAIIGVLAALIYMNLGHPQGQALAKGSMQQLGQISTALESYHVDCFDYPGGTTGTAPCTGGSGNVVNPALFGGTSNKYFNSTPTLQAQDYTYSYVAGTTTSSPAYVICSPYVIDSSTVSQLPSGTGNGSGTSGVGVCFSTTTGYFHT